MIAATLRQPPASGIRRVALAQDLGAIADLIETCFAPRMDASGRATVREMRALSHLGPALPALALGDDMLRGIGKGFVWQEQGQIIGNVTLFPARYPPDLPRTYVVANVAVHPDHRRRGIARQLMDAALDTIAAEGGQQVILQVEHDNTGARRLYLGMGFTVQRTWHRWQRSTRLAEPPRPRHAPKITPRPGSAWRGEYALAAEVFPAVRGGLGWMRPLHAREFTRSPWKTALDFLSGTSIERWAVQQGEQIIGSLWARTRFGSSTVWLTLIVHPAWRGVVDGPLLNYAARRFTATAGALEIEHPVDDRAASAALEATGFTPYRTLDHMVYKLQAKARG